MNLFRNWYATLTANWREAFRDENFRRYFVPNFLVCLVVYYCVIYWLNLNSTRPGMIINDPLYRFLEPRDFSAIIFFFTYSAAFLTLLYVLQYPLLLQRALVAFVAIFVIRAVCIYFIPLSPSPGIVPLIDPFTDTMGHEGRIMNDLFFSGHVADLVLFVILCRSVMLKRYLLLCTIAVATLLIWQRVHYTIDVMVAPAFAYACFWLFVDKDFIWKPFLKKPQFESN